MSMSGPSCAIPKRSAPPKSPQRWLSIMAGQPTPRLTYLPLIKGNPGKPFKETVVLQESRDYIYPDSPNTSNTHTVDVSEISNNH